MISATARGIVRALISAGDTLALIGMGGGEQRLVARLRPGRNAHDAPRRLRPVAFTGGNVEFPGTETRGIHGQMQPLVAAAERFFLLPPRRDITPIDAIEAASERRHARQEATADRGRERLELHRLPTRHRLAQAPPGLAAVE